MVNQPIGKHGLGIFWWSDLTLGPPSRSNEDGPKLKVLITGLLLVLEVWDGKPTYGKSWTGNLLVWSDWLVGCYGNEFENLR